MEFTGLIKQALPASSGTSQTTGKEWTRQQFIIEEVSNTEYKDTILVLCFQAPLISWLAGNVGAIVTLNIDARLRDYEGRYYQDLLVWGCTYNGVRVGQEPPTPAQPAQPTPTNNPASIRAKDIPPLPENIDALPF